MFNNIRELKVLCLDDSSERGILLLPHLKSLNQRFSFQRIFHPFEIDNTFQNQHWDLMFFFCPSNHREIFEILGTVRKLKADLPFILITDGLCEENVVHLIKAGVDDIVVASRMETVVAAIQRALQKNELKNNEAKTLDLAHAALASKDQMIAVVSHDIKNPLCAIQLQAQMLLRSEERVGKSLLSEEVKIQANRILKTTERMKLLITDILEKNKSENSLSDLSKTKIHLGHLIKDVIDACRPLIQEKEITLRWSVPEDKILNLDRNKIFQVVSNLLNNAIKFTPRNGVIEIHYSEDELQDVISISDSGPGLDKNQIHKVFEKYWTGHSSPGGTGLGLFICKTIVEAHGGRIHAKNNENGKGACFEFCLPKKDILKPLDERKIICLIDDDEDLTELITWVLGLEHFKVCTFKSPAEGLKFLTQQPISPSLIILNHKMDEMMGGEFIKKQKEIELVKDCPVIMISASPREIEAEIPREYYKEVITKPLDLESLVTCIKKHLMATTGL